MTKINAKCLKGATNGKIRMTTCAAMKTDMLWRLCKSIKGPVTLFCTCADLTNSGCINEYGLGEENGGVINNFVCLVTSIMTDCNRSIGFRVDSILWLHSLVRSMVRSICSFALLHYVMYILTTGTNAHVTPLLLTPPAKRWGIGVGSFCTRHVCLSIRLGIFYLKSRWPPIPPMVRTAIIEYI